MEPFGITIDHFIPVYHLMLSSYGVISAMTVIVCIKLLPKNKAILNYTNSPFKLGVWMLLLLIAVSLSNWLYSQLLHHTISGWYHMYVPVRSFFELMPQFLSIYLLWGVVSWVLIYLLQKNTNHHLNDVNKQNELIKLYSDNQSDGFKVKQNQLVCLKTSDNYLEVYYLNEQEELQNRMIRSSMKKMLGNLDADCFYRPHQSYLVNLDYIKGLKKVQNNHFLEMAYLDFDVAISRRNVKNIRSFIIS